MSAREGRRTATAVASQVAAARADSPPAAPPCLLVIFGASGDLTRRKLLPALYNLRRAGLLSDRFSVLGTARTEMTDSQFRDLAGQGLKTCDEGHPNEDDVEWLSDRMHYLMVDAEDPSAYGRLAARADALEREYQTDGNVIFYLATIPQLFGRIATELGKAGLATETPDRRRRLIVEKPFGRDLESARSLNRELRSVLAERQIYRIDHYLGKETVQNILAFRFGNGVFEPIWNRRYVDHVQITAAEADGVADRGGYYESSGALRDMVPNHLFQLITLTAMEPPVSFHPDAVRDEQTKILRAIQPFTTDDVAGRTVRGQYAAGRVGGTEVPGYRAESKVAPDSQTATFVALEVLIDNWRWAGVPFYLRTGKRMARRLTEITIQFRRAPFQLFRDTPVEALRPNRLVMHIQPHEGISLGFSAKIPGPQLRLGDVDMRFDYADYFGCNANTGYERLLYDCMVGDATLFQRADMVEAAWAVVQPILEEWQAGARRELPTYPAGSWGPPEAFELLERDGRAWKDGAAT
jgi:glucose-6-phosphate 1-dehydrogenase